MRGSTAARPSTGSRSCRQIAVKYSRAHSPESGTRQGLTQYDERVSQPTLADELAERHELEAALARIDHDEAGET